jgi:hypothetical protein
MQLRWKIGSSMTIALMIAALPAAADTLRSEVAFNNGIAEATASQPAGGIEVAYQITLQGGELDGCTVDVVEALHPRDEGAWGIFDIEGEVSDGGRFAYASSGAWDGAGFHAAGDIKGGSGSGAFEGIAGRGAQLGGGASEASEGTLDIFYALVFATDED